MILAHRIRMYPTDAQAEYFVKACGVARFAYNWALAEWRRLYAAGEKVSESELRKKLNSIKRDQFPWMLEVTKCAPQLAIKDLGAAYKNFFEGRTRRPQFKKRGHRDGFRISNDQFLIEGERIRIPSLGWVRLAEPLRFGEKGKILGAAVSRRVDEWFVSVQVELPDPAPLHGKDQDGDESSVRVVFGMENSRLGPDGELEDGPLLEETESHRALLARMRRLDRSLKRKAEAGKQGRRSKNYTETRNRLLKLRARVADIRGDALHKLTTHLTRNYAAIAAENPAGPGASKKREVPDSLAKASFFEFRRQLEYKARITGSGTELPERKEEKEEPES